MRDDFYYFKWEFIRRNPGYIEEYKRYVLFAKSSQYKKIKRGVYQCKKTGKFSVIFEKPLRFPLRKFLDPAINFNAYKSKDRNFESNFIDSDLTIETTLNVKQYAQQLKYLEGHSLLDKNDENMVVGQFCINIRSAKKKILKQFNDYLAKVYRDKVNRSIVNKRKKFRSGNYRQYLKIYDYILKYGKRWKSAAKFFYRADFERGELYYAIRKVKRDYERCKRLILGK